MVVDKNKEQDETDKSADECQQPEKQALRGPDAVSLGVVGHLAGGNAYVVVLLAPEPVRGGYSTEKGSKKTARDNTNLGFFPMFFHMASRTAAAIKLYSMTNG